MGYPAFFLYSYLPLEILLIGIILLLLLGALSPKIVSRFKKLRTRMRIISGYITLISCIISVVMYSYIYSPLGSNHSIALNLNITAYTTGLYYAIAFAVIIGTFLSIVEVDLKFRKNHVLYVSLLLINVSTFFITSAKSLVFIFFGFVIMFSSINFFIRNFTADLPRKQKSFIRNYLMISSLALSFLFVGFSAHSLSGNEFLLSIDNTTLQFWEYLSEIFIVTGLLILIGGPPFHFTFFESEDVKFNSITQIIISVQKGLALAFLTRYTVTIAASPLSSVLIWLYTVCGSVYVIWGVFAAMTEERLQKLIHYISIIFSGIILVILSDLFSTVLTEEVINLTLRTVSYGILIFILTISLSISSVGAISKSFQSDSIEVLREVSRYSLSQFIFLLLNALVLFAGPLSILIVSEKITFPEYLCPRMITTTIILLVGAVFSLIYLYRLLKHIFFIPLQMKFEFSSPEPGIFLASFIAFVLTIIVIIFFKQFLIFCSLIGLNIA